MVKASSLPETATGPSIDELRPDFRTSLEAANLSPRTTQSYMEAVDQLDAFLARTGMPRRVRAVRREHVEAFIADLLDRHKATTAANRYAGLRAFFRWAEAEEEIESSPMAKMRKPRLPEEHQPVLTTDEIMRVRRACEGTTFDDRRDAAIIALFVATGMRLAELTSLTTRMYDAAARTVTFTGKGSRARTDHVEAWAAQVLNRYIRARREHHHADDPALWLGQRGPMTVSGVADAVERRGRLAGVENLHPHRFRHARAHDLLRHGVNEGAVMALMGWRSREMLGRYASALANERAIEQARDLEARRRR